MFKTYQPHTHREHWGFTTSSFRACAHTAGVPSCRAKSAKCNLPFFVFSSNTALLSMWIHYRTVKYLQLVYKPTTFPPRTNRLLSLHRDSGTLAGTCKLLKQYILSLKRKGNVKSSGAEGITTTFQFMLQGHAAQQEARFARRKTSVKIRKRTAQLSVQRELPSVTDVKALWMMHSLNFGCFLSSRTHCHVAVESTERETEDALPRCEMFKPWFDFQSLRARELSPSQDQKLHLFHSSASLKGSLRFSKALN